MRRHRNVFGSAAGIVTETDLLMFKQLMKQPFDPELPLSARQKEKYQTTLIRIMFPTKEDLPPTAQRNHDALPETPTKGSRTQVRIQHHGPSFTAKTFENDR
jgi:hypothetical protein